MYILYIKNGESKNSHNYLKKLINDSGLSKITNFFGNNLEDILFFKEKELKEILGLNDDELKKNMEIRRNYEGLSSGRFVKLSKCGKTNTRLRIFFKLL